MQYITSFITNLHMPGKTKHRCKISMKNTTNRHKFICDDFELLTCVISLVGCWSNPNTRRCTCSVILFVNSLLTFHTLHNMCLHAKSPSDIYDVFLMYWPIFTMHMLITHILNQQVCANIQPEYSHTSISLYREIHLPRGEVIRLVTEL